MELQFSSNRSGTFVFCVMLQWDSPVRYSPWDTEVLCEHFPVRWYFGWRNLRAFGDKQLQRMYLTLFEQVMTPSDREHQWAFVWEGARDILLKTTQNRGSYLRFRAIMSMRC